MKRPAGAAAAILTIALLLAGCTPGPAPTPTPTGFASEEEAFAAAEETYRAYVDALNQVDLSDPETFEAVYAWTTGDLNQSDRKGLTGFHARGATKTGESKVTLVALAGTDRGFDSIDIAACSDVSAVEITSASGESLVSPDRSDVQSVLVELVQDPDSPTGYYLVSIGGREGTPSCG